MRFRLFNGLPFLIGFLLIFTSATVAQRLSQGSKLVETELSDVLEAFCSNLSGGFRVCRVRKNEDADAEFIIQKGGSTVSSIQAPFWSLAGVDPDSFFAYRGDLDLDGTNEIVLVSMEGVSNGMGITFSTAYVFDGKTVESHGRPISFSVEEFSHKENFIYDSRAHRTNILITYWKSYETIDPKRGWGMYLMGKWFRYRHGKLEPIATKPTLARRFLYSFAEERDNGSFENREPYTWLKDRRTHMLNREPAESSTLIRTEFGTVNELVEPEINADQQITLAILLDSGYTVNGAFNLIWRSADKRDPELLNFEAIGLWKSRFLYPLSRSGNFRPSAFMDRVVGRRVRLETYKPEYRDDEFTNVWFLD